MKLIFPHYYFTILLKLFCPRKVRIFQWFAGFAEKSLKKIKKKGLTAYKPVCYDVDTTNEGNGKSRLKGERK